MRGAPAVTALRMERVPAVSFWVPPTAFLLHACRPTRWWIRFRCGATIEYFGCRPTGKATVVETCHLAVSVPPYEGGACRYGPPDGTCAHRFVLVPPMVFLLHACRPIRWWIRFHCGATIEYLEVVGLRAKPRRLKQPTGLFLRAGPLDGACARRFVLVPPIAFLLHACRPIRWWIRFHCGATIEYLEVVGLRAKPRRLKRATGTFLRAGFRIHNHLPPKQKKDIPFGMSFCFGGRWWIRTTEVIDDRFTVCSLWPLGKPSIFSFQLVGAGGRT